MRILIFLKISIVFLSFSQCKKESIDHKAIDHYKEQLSLIKSQYLDGNSKVKASNAIITLEELTKIKSYEDHSFQQKSLKIPLKYNLKSWELWLELNKQNIYFDENKKIKVKDEGSIEMPKHNPSELFLEYLNDLKKMKQVDKYHINEIDFLLNIIQETTHFKNSNFNDICDCYFPDGDDFINIEKWFKSNNEKLSWNKQKQKIEFLIK